MASQSKPSVSIASIVAIVAAILSFKFGAFLGLIFAGVAFVSGVLGIALAQSPRIRGGFISVTAVVLSFIGAIAAVIKFIMWIF